MYIQAPYALNLRNAVQCGKFYLYVLAWFYIRSWCSLSRSRDPSACRRVYIVHRNKVSWRLNTALFLFPYVERVRIWWSWVAYSYSYVENATELVIKFLGFFWRFWNRPGLLIMFRRGVSFEDELMKRCETFDMNLLKSYVERLRTNKEIKE